LNRSIRCCGNLARKTKMREAITTIAGGLDLLSDVISRNWLGRFTRKTDRREKICLLLRRSGGGQIFVDPIHAGSHVMGKSTECFAVLLSRHEEMVRSISGV
jgi:hypothetical protein